MATDLKGTELTALTSVTDDDLLVVVDSPGGTPVTKSITFAYLASSLASHTDTYTNKTLTNPTVTTGTFTSPTITTPTITGLTLSAGSTTVAPLTLTIGTNLTTPVTGTIEFDGTDFYITI